MRDCQEQNREGDLGRSPGNGWLGGPNRTIYNMLGQAVTFGIRAEDDSS
jgi:hypothetical protein